MPCPVLAGHRSLLVDATDIEKDDEERKQAIRDKLRANLAAARKPTGQDNRNRKEQIRQIDLCIGITKCDMVPSLLQEVLTAKDGGASAAARYIHKHLGNFDKILQHTTKIKEIRYFAVSAVGQTQSDSKNNTLPVAGQIRPIGYGPMFHWVAERPLRINARRWWNFFCTALLVAAFIVLIAVLSWRGKKGIDGEMERRALATLDNSNLSIVERLEQTKPREPRERFSGRVIQKREEIADEELSRLEGDIRQAEDQYTLDAKRGDLERMEEVAPANRRIRIDELKKEVNRKLVGGDFQRVKDAFEHHRSDFAELSDRFLQNHPTSSQAAEVREMIDNYRKGELETARNEIKKIVVSNRAHLEEKSKRIVEFISAYRSRLSGNEPELKSMERAATLAHRFSEKQEYQARLIRYGGFAYGENQIAFIYVNGQAVCRHASEGKSKEVNPGTSFTFSWQCGEPIRLEIQAYAGRVWGGIETVADTKSNSPSALKQLSGMTKLKPWTSSWDWSLPKRMGPGGYFIECKLDDIDDSDWADFHNYISPGEAW